MQTIRMTAGWLRLALAMAFAIVSVVQVPAMTITHAMSTTLPLATGSGEHLTAAASHDDHHHSHSDHRHHSESAADIIDDSSPCHAVGCHNTMACCIALPAADMLSPAVTELLIGILDLVPASAMVPALLEPDDPPPRLQA